MYFLHFSPVTVSQNCFIPSTSSSLLCGFTSRHTNSFNSCHVFYGVQVWRFRRSGPPVDAVVLQECFGQRGGVFGVVILHESVSIWEHLMKEWQKGLLQNLCVHRSIHSALEYADTSPSSHTYASPNVHLCWVLWPV